jgi:putative polyhydroxyalkanoate system protein
MSEITVTRSHPFPPDEAKTRVERVVEELAQKYSMTSEWQGDDKMAISAMGVSGQIELRASEIVVSVEKSFWVPVSDEQIEASINKALDRGLA